MRRYKPIVFKEEVDVSNVIKDVIETKWSGSNEEQMKIVNLLKGLATSDDPKSNKFMKALDKATSDMKAEDFKEGKKLKENEYGIKYPQLLARDLLELNDLIDSLKNTRSKIYKNFGSSSLKNNQIGLDLGELQQEIDSLGFTISHFVGKYYETVKNLR